MKKEVGIQIPVSSRNIGFLQRRSTFFGDLTYFIINQFLSDSPLIDLLGSISLNLVNCNEERSRTINLLETLCIHRNSLQKEAMSMTLLSSRAFS